MKSNNKKYVLGQLDRELKREPLWAQKTSSADDALLNIADSCLTKAKSAILKLSALVTSSQKREEKIKEYTTLKDVVHNTIGVILSIDIIINNTEGVVNDMVIRAIHIALRDLYDLESKIEELPYEEVNFYNLIFTEEPLCCGFRKYTITNDLPEDREESQELSWDTEDPYVSNWDTEKIREELTSLFPKAPAEDLELAVKWVLENK